MKPPLGSHFDRSLTRHQLKAEIQELSNMEFGASELLYAYADTQAVIWGAQVYPPPAFKDVFWVALKSIGRYQELEPNGGDDLYNLFLATVGMHWSGGRDKKQRLISNFIRCVSHDR